MDDIAAVILADVEDARMESKRPKVCHEVLGKSMIQHVIDCVRSAGIENIFIVAEHNADEIKSFIRGNVTFLPDERHDAGYVHYLENHEAILVLPGDMPLITNDTIVSMVSHHNKHGYCGTILTLEYKDGASYGEAAGGVYCFNTGKLLEALKLLANTKDKNPYNLNSIIETMKNNGFQIGTYKIHDIYEVMKVNTRMDLADCTRIMGKRVLDRLMDQGVTIIDPNSTYIGVDVSVERDTVIYPGTIIEGFTTIGEDCKIGPYSRLVNVIVHDGVEIMNSVVLESEVKSNTHVGPFAYIRPESVIGENVKIGDFVEIKKSTIGNDTKVSHLTYIGDSEVGRNVNFGCGTVTVNYDGKKKHKTIIGDNVFIGCNTNLVSPVKVNNNAYIAAGSTITDEVPEGSLAIARERQVIKEGWVEKKGMQRK